MLDEIDSLPFNLFTNCPMKPDRPKKHQFNVMQPQALGLAHSQVRKGATPVIGMYQVVSKDSQSVRAMAPLVRFVEDCQFTAFSGQAGVNAVLSQCIGHPITLMLLSALRTVDQEGKALECSVSEYDTDLRLIALIASQVPLNYLGDSIASYWVIEQFQETIED